MSISRKILLALSTYGLVSLFSCQQTKDSVIETLLKNEAEKFNKSGGQILDSETKMDSMSVSSGKVINYYFTLRNYKKSSVDTTQFKKQIRPEMIKMLKNDARLKMLRDNEVTFSYHYYDKNGTRVYDIIIGPEAYKIK